MIFLIISIILFNLIAYKMPKRISLIEILAGVLFAFMMQAVADIYLAIKHHLYYYFSRDIDYLTFLPVFGLYPAISAIYLNYYPINRKLLKKSLYILYWSLFSLLFEWLSVKSGYFILNGWRLWYSVPLYPLIFIMLALFLKLTRKLVIKACEDLKNKR